MIRISTLRSRSGPYKDHETATAKRQYIEDEISNDLLHEVAA